MEFVDGIDFRQGTDELAATFAVERGNAEIGGEVIEEFCEREAMDGDLETKGSRDFGRFIASDEQVDGAAGGGEEGMCWIESAAPRDNAAERVSGRGHRHVIRFQCAASDEDGS